MYRSSKILKSFAFCVFLFASLLLAQESKTAKTDSIKTQSSNQPNVPQAEEGDVKITDGTNTLIRITDEGTFGAIEINNGVPSTTTDKLYNDGGTLKFNGSTVGGGSGTTAINDLSDAKYDGRSLYLGENSGDNDDGSNDNVAVGKDALKSNTSGKNNTASGVASLQNNTSGNANTAFGELSLFTNTTADSNTAIGWQALRSNSTGSFNTSNGTAALWKNTTGRYNTANGYNALKLNTTGNYNTAIGAKSLYSNEVGQYNTAIGNNSLNHNKASRNTAIGNNSLTSNTMGTNNTAFGDEALKNNLDGDGNVGLGKSALFTNNSGGGNIGVGLNSLYLNTTGSKNIALGQGSQYYNTTGSNNIGIGYRANLNNATGANNTVIGYEAGAGAGSSKSGSVFIGHQAGYNETSGDKLYIDNSNTDSPLIWGDFFWDSVRVNGTLDVTEGVKIGSIGTHINNIVVVTGITDASDNETTVDYPIASELGTNKPNTHVLALKIKDDANYYNAIAMDANDAFSVKLGDFDMTITIPNNTFRGKEYQLVLMKIE